MRKSAFYRQFILTAAIALAAVLPALAAPIGTNPNLPHFGVVDMTDTSFTNPPKYDLTKDAAWKNSVAKVVLVRTTWAVIQGVDHNHYDWSWFDTAIQLAQTNHKQVAFVLLSGFDSPSWVYDAPWNVRKYTVLNQDQTVKGVMPIPWDLTFQDLWGNFVRTFAARYAASPYLAYTNISGVAREHETVFITSDDQFDLLDGIAKADGYSGCMDAWGAAAKWCSDLYCNAFPQPNIFIGRIPVSGCSVAGRNDLGEQTLKDLVYSEAAHYSNFGFASDGLGPNPSQPAPTSPGIYLVQGLAPTNVVGYQYFGTLSTVDDLNTAQDKAIANGAYYIETWKANCNNTGQDWIDALQSANDRILPAVTAVSTRNWSPYK